MLNRRSHSPFTKSLVALVAGLEILALTHGPAGAADEFYQLRTNKKDFKYFELGSHVPSRSGRKPFPLARFVVAPDIGLPMEIAPKAGEHMFCNSQYYNLGGGGAPTEPGAPNVGVDSGENYFFPWTSNFCEKRGRNGNKVCGTQYQEHMGQDCRPPTPSSAPKYWVVAVDDGIARNIGAGHSIAIENDRFRWAYLHMANRQVVPGQRIRKGQRLGQVWNVMQGGTSIHLHIELKFKDKGEYVQLDPLPSLIAAYHRALGNSFVINEDGTLAYDAAFEMRGPAVTAPSLCDGAESRPSLGTEAVHTFSELWCHNGSLMGLAANGASRRIVYYKPRNDDLAASVKGDAVLLEASATGEQWSGKARHYSSRCGNRQFDVAGAMSADGKRLQVSGRRDSFSGKTCDLVSNVAEDLVFSYVGSFPRASTDSGSQNQPPRTGSGQINQPASGPGR